MNKLFADLMEKNPTTTAPPAVSPAPSPVEERAVQPPTMEREPPKQTETQKKKTPESTKAATLDETNIAILQLSKTDIGELRATAFKNQTFRFSEDELNWLRDRSYGLTRALGRKVGQNDLLRLSLKVFRKLIADKQEVLEEILDPII